MHYLTQPLRALLIIMLLVFSCDSKKEGIFISGLKTEYLENPVGLDVSSPRFSWIIESPGQRGTRQSAYQIILSENKEDAGNDQGGYWNTGKVNSDQSVNIKYDGPPLKSETNYYWRVLVWTNKSQQPVSSEVNSFYIGLLDAGEWKAGWITNGDSTVAAPLFRTEFNVEKEVRSAYTYVTGMGYYEFYLNGSRIGDHVLDPGMTDFRKRVLYSTYDVRDQIRQGDNAIGLMLGNGAFRLKRPEERYAWHDPGPIKGTPRGILQLRINYTDGTSELITSNNNWKTSSGPITFNNVFGGEDYDARLEQEGWSKAGFNDREWQNAKVVALEDLIMDAQVMPAIKVTQTITPVKQVSLNKGLFLYDMGQNFPGWWRIRVQGAPGTKITIRGAETLNNELFPSKLEEGDSLSTKHRYHKNVWTTYILKGENEEVYEPRFFYTGYRYMEVNVNKPDDLVSLEVEGRVVHSDLKRNGRFKTSDSLLNRIYEATIWSQRGNLHGYPSDCPHREKGAYNGDGQVIAEVSMHDFHMHALYEKWLNDMYDAQEPNGRIPNTSPTIIGGHGGGIAWGSAYILLPWWMNLYYDDVDIVHKHYPTMKKYMDYLHRLAANDEHPDERYIINEFGGHWDSLGEWCAPGGGNGPNNPLVSTYYWYLDCVTMAEIAGTLERAGERQYYLALADTIKQAFNDKFFDPSTNLYGVDSVYQTYLLFALEQDLVPEGHKEAVLQNLIDDIMITRDGHLNTGILGTKHLFRVLEKEGRQDVIHTIVSQTTYPGWGFWIENRATTLWEKWSGESSHNHQMFGTVSEYFYKYLAGIHAPTDEGTAAGYKSIHIKPYVPEQLSWVEASVGTVRGQVSSRWEKTGNGLKLMVTIPANTSGKISIPVPGIEEVVITESGQKLWQDGKITEEIEGIAGGYRDGQYIVVEVEPGTYRFECSLD